MLVERIGVEPGPELRRLQEAILRQDVSLEAWPAAAELPPELDAGTAPLLVGRRSELAWVHQRWEQARTGRRNLVTLTGVRGIGKSRMAAELAGDADRVGAGVVYCSGRGPPEAVRAALGRAREASRATLLVVDDADEAGAEALGELAKLTRVIAHVPVLALALAEHAESLAPVGADGGLTLEPLDEEAVTAIAALHAPAHADETMPVEWLLETSGGVPSSVHEVAGSGPSARRHVG